ncbi:hypothetical protein [Isachenkonia alkalipeptolytica]|uniref:Lipoprotein n=1 Tax=Isachenkonia alkalipeptolytica TaxID=2565777 RepID=A0AA43XN61_9CLOT|nr:hypothetical protein [Isachenkonia alkalipeptolytica]NBG89481.1 hypothetical protein [Isachenkonia alkalipeptolytica]
MDKKYLLIVLIVAVSILVGCGNATSSENNNEGTNEQESVELNNLSVPETLKIMTPEANKKNQELNSSLNNIMDEFDGGENLSEAEQEEYEAQMEAHSNKMEELEEEIMMIDDQEIIENIFDEIKDSEAVYNDNLDESVIKEGQFYSLEPQYSNRDKDESILEYINLIMAFEDNTLFLITGEEVESPTVIKMDFDYEWLENQFSQ